MINENEARDVAHEAMNVMRNKMTVTDWQSFGLVIGLVLSIALDNVQDNLSSDDCALFIAEFHKFIDYLPAIYAIRGALPKDERRSV